MGDIDDLQSLGIALPSPAYIIGVILFSVVGFVAYRFGKKTAQPTTRWIGIALMLFPYAVSDTWLLYLVGAALSAAAYYYRR